MQQSTGENVELAWADQGYAGPAAAEAAQQQGTQWEAVKLPATRKGFVLLPRRWAVERTSVGPTRFPRLIRYLEGLPEPSPAYASSLSRAYSYKAPSWKLRKVNYRLQP